MAETIERELRRMSSELRAMKGQNLSISAAETMANTGVDIEFKTKPWHSVDITFHPSEGYVENPQVNVWIKSMEMSNYSSDKLLAETTVVYLDSTVWRILVPSAYSSTGTTSSDDITVGVHVSSLVHGTLTYEDKGEPTNG